MAEEKTCELSNIIPPLVLGGSGFNDQINPDPRSLPVRSIIKAAFELGIRAFDTSPYYGPSEELIGDALSQPDITKKYARSEYTLMTKVGRISATEFNYSPTWVEYSVRRSLQRLQTSYLDVVFCHDVEFVTESEVMGALEVLYKLVAQGLIRYVGISGYRLDTLVMLCRAARLCYGRPLDIVQCWAQLTLQNTRLLSDDEGLQALRKEGVSCICNSSPLAIGLLRSGGVPQGSLGDFHPAPAELRALAQQAAQWVEAQGESLSALSLRFSISQALLASSTDLRVSTITGVSSIHELKENVAAARQVFGHEEGLSNPGLQGLETPFAFTPPQSLQLRQDQPLYDGVQKIFNRWLGYSF
ncbi:Aldo/keto reductase family-domain-containing protein [Penicillium sp. IBT 18751x]|nr:Aldo/keto reductase family-domain-containing protein [Penicillium sp. IBT 18751x]